MAYEQIPFLLPLLLWVCTQKPLPTLPAALFWGGSLLLSWVFFLLSRAPGMPPSIAEWPFLFYLVWLVYVMKKSKPRMV